jgi:hypothetical protein
MNKRRSDEIAGKLSALFREIAILDVNIGIFDGVLQRAWKDRETAEAYREAARAKLSHYLRHLEDGESVHAFALSREKSRRTFSIEDGMVASGTSVDVFCLAERIAAFEAKHKDTSVKAPDCPCQDTFPAEGVESAEFGPSDLIEFKFVPPFEEEII